MLRTAVIASLLPLGVLASPSRLADYRPGSELLRRTLVVSLQPSGRIPVCETYITITQYPSDPYYQGSAAFVVEWGEIYTEDPICISQGDPDGATFRFYLNGADSTSKFNVGLNSATGTLQLPDERRDTVLVTITGHDSSGNPRQDSDTRNFYVDTTPAPAINLNPYNYDHQSMARCEASCFAATYAHTTPAYFTLDTPRNVTLVYHGDRVSPRPFVHVDVSHPGGTYNVPQQFWLEVKRNGAFEAFSNGETRLRFTGSSQTVRLGGQLRDVGNLPTGVYDIQIIVSSQFSTKVEQTVVNSKLTIVNENTSPIARGWFVAGVQRLYPSQDANGSVLITEGDGSALYFNRPCSNCSYTTPIGDFTTLVATQGGWTRIYPGDSSRVVFNVVGRHIQTVDRFGNTVTLVYDASWRLQKIQDPTHNQPASREIVLSYGSYGLSSIADPMGRTTIVTVASDSTLRTIKDPDGDSTRFSYDSDRRLQMVYDRQGSRSRVAYRSQSWKLDSLILPPVPINGGTAESLVVRFSPWQIVGVPTGSTSSAPFTPVLPSAVQGSVTDPEGHTTTLRSDRWGQPMVAWSPLGDSAVFTRNGSGQLTRLRYPWGAEDAWGYDTRGRLTSQTLPDGGTINVRYGKFGQPDSIWATAQGTNQGGQFVFLNASTGAADSIRIGGQDTIKARNQFDSRGRLTRAIDPRADTTWLHYDATFGNLDSVLQHGNGFSRARFDRYGRDSLSQVQNLPWSMVLYDLLNRPTQIYDTLGAAATVLTYDRLFLIRLRDPKFQVYRFEYNALGWLTRRFDPADTLNRYDSYRYDRDGRLIGWTNRRGQAVSLAYDALDRLLAKTGTNTVADSFAYSTDFRRVVAWNSVARDSLFLTGRLRPDSVVTRLAGRRFRFYYRRNGLGRLDSVSISDPGGVAFQTRRFGRNQYTLAIDTLRLGTASTRLTHNSDGLVTQSVWPTSPSLTRTLRYTQRHFLHFDSLSEASLAGAGRGWGYDSLGRVLQEIRGRPSLTSSWPGRAFEYDRAGRVSLERFGSLAVCALNAVYGYSCSVTSDSLKAYNYDAVGNRTDRGTYATGNRILTWVGGFTFEHDLDGNVTRRNGGSGQDTYFYWSAEGRLDSVVSGSTRLHYSYDASGRLVRRQRNGTTERYFLWDGAQLVAELTAAGTQRIAEYAYYPGIDRPLAIITGTGAGTTRYFTQDVIGNVTGVVAGSSSFQGINYDAWGQHNVSGTLGDTNRLRWKGLVWEGDVTQLYYMRNRWYEPRTGRFLSEDPIGLEGGINAYLFAAADPIGGVDPLGLCGKERSERCQCILKDDPTGNPEHIDWVPCDGQPGLPGVGVVVFGDQFACYHGRVCVSGNSSGGRRHLRPVPRPPTPRERELAMFITPLQQPIGCGAGVLMTVASGALDIAFFGAVVDVAVGAVRSLAGAFRWALGGGGVSAEPVQQFARGWIRAHEELPPHGVGVTVGVVGTGTASGGDFVPGATTYRFASFAADQCGIL